MDADLTVQIVNYDTKRYLRPCLLHLQTSFGDASDCPHVTVLNNGSTDDLSDLASEFEGFAEFVESPINRGFGGGHNLLASKSKSSLICFLNPDIEISQEHVFPRLSTFFVDPRVSAVGPLLRTTSGSPQEWDHGELRGIRSFIANGAGHAHWQRRSERTPVAWVSGAFMIVRRSAFEAVGGFDENYFLYKEEEDLCLQLRRRGGTILYEPTVEVTHVGSVVAKRDPKYFAASIAHYKKKNFNSQWRQRLFDLLYLHVTRRL